MNQIPKLLHVVWVGDDTRRPDNCIESWRELHPDWTLKVWGNEERASKDWVNEAHMQGFERTGQLCGVADLMRWEILQRYGGVAVDADAVCLSAIPDWLLDCAFFACYENEFEAPGLVTNCFVGTHPENPVVEELVRSIHERRDVAERFVWYALKKKKQRAWKSSGPRALTQALKRLKYRDATLLPSHFFLPIHFTGQAYRGGGPVIASQMFGSTHGTQYESLSQATTAQLRVDILGKIGPK